MQTGLEKFLSWNKAELSSSTSPGTTWTPINTRATAKEERQMKRITTRGENRTMGGPRRSSGISTSLTRTRTFPIFIYDSRARFSAGSWTGKVSSPSSERAKHEIRASAYSRDEHWINEIKASWGITLRKLEKCTWLNHRRSNLTEVLTSKFTHRLWTVSEVKWDVNFCRKANKIKGKND